ncbi:cytochrome b-c1 complex subunit 7 [Plectosphaerella cucumerina]|uniref:Cytochrome b-c1 complex subunit 7 n=1 Tax=Plectosphaerella cucumerina TaxID=40658 RepID=A0A8K0TGA3_9PEZI|nr:cytochrome b-c1 complex subunit 7 [Plectosphaerella cucumerina]
MADLGARIAENIVRRPSLLNIVKPLANWYANAAGWRKLGLRYDDLYQEENAPVALALKRLSPKESYDRIFRIRRAVQLSYQHKLLPKEQWTKAEEDVPYLAPLIDAARAEIQEREALDTLEVVKKH